MPDETGQAPYRPGELALPTADMRNAGHRAIDLVVERLRSVRHTAPHATADPAALKALLDEPLPEDGRDLTEVIEQVTQQALPLGIRFDHPRCLAFIPTTGNFPAALADLLAAAYLSVPGAWLVGSGPTRIELTALSWLCELLGLPETWGGLFVSGGSVANLTALAAARDHHLAGDLTDARLYCSTQAHPSIARAAHLLGLDRSQLTSLPPDTGHRLDPRLLSARLTQDRAAGLRPFAVVATLGTTSTGAIDPLTELADICRDHRLWLHIDGAHGAAYAATARGHHLRPALRRADSLVIDPHKWLFQPYETGCVLVRDPALLKNTFRMERHHLDTGYLRPSRARGDEINLDDYGPQQSRGLRALKLWLSLKTFGATAFRRAIDHGLDLAEHAADRITAHRELRLVTPPGVGILTFAYEPPGPEPDLAAMDRLQYEVSEAVCASGQAVILTTRVHGRTTLRMCTINPATTSVDIDTTLDLVVQTGRACRIRTRSR
ncbi:pyridoxal phosphate-dependent decarboxylase family protein [Streptomyces boncukensis]|uniref:Aminotransferase class V-fold PLP-dependent enzyme n=1 Tax=Streptomyces boncukensis TaxID=2711219 RepID=A0A6G4X5V5_9ACTN|nr:pyridoxal-dependent decarboxylase [Streptomyces boncukensis]NGO72124.1 aminotransferase class V-fold PLP-dependent enzyme [Streptomyces boncukensis]